MKLDELVRRMGYIPDFETRRMNPRDQLKHEAIASAVRRISYAGMADCELDSAAHLQWVRLAFQQAFANVLSDVFDTEVRAQVIREHEEIFRVLDDILVPNERG